MLLSPIHEQQRRTLIMKVMSPATEDLARLLSGALAAVTFDPPGSRLLVMFMIQEMNLILISAHKI